MTADLDMQAVLDALGHGVLIFSSDGKLERHNMMAGKILGTDLNVIKSEGWSAAIQLFEVESPEAQLEMNSIRDQAMHSERPVRFKIFRSGAYIPCWAAALPDADGDIHTMLTLDSPDWKIVDNVIDRFRDEMRDSIDSTIGHIDLIERTLGKDEDERSDAANKIARRIGGFTRLINIHMNRSRRLLPMLTRLQDIRTGDLHDKIRRTRRDIDMFNFVEDFIEELDEIQLLDPESERHDYRSRVEMDVPEDVTITASPVYVSFALRETVRNAIMYSLIGTPITIKVRRKSADAPNVQIDITDEGYGVREKEWNRVFEPFARARQPQIISEFGYGLALYLCKHEIEAMNGRLWFTSEENVGTTVSILLPAARATDDDTSSSSDSENDS